MKRVGISSLERHTATAASYDTLSSTLSTSQLNALQSQLALFQSSLRTFAQKHAASIRSDPAFRTAFSSMCAQLGVDPLGGGKRGLWGFIGVGNWTYELAVQLVDVCLRNRDRNGGLMDMADALRAIHELRHGPIRSDPTLVPRSASEPRARNDWNGAVTEGDVVRALKALQPLGCGYAVVTVGDRKMVRSTPAELDTDSLFIIEAASATGFTTHQGLRQRGQWSLERASDALSKALVQDGLLWIDEQVEHAQSERFYVGHHADGQI